MGSGDEVDVDFPDPTTVSISAGKWRGKLEPSGDILWNDGDLWKADALTPRQKGKFHPSFGSSPSEKDKKRHSHKSPPRSPRSSLPGHEVKAVLAAEEPPHRWPIGLTAD